MGRKYSEGSKPFFPMVDTVKKLEEVRELHILCMVEIIAAFTADRAQSDEVKYYVCEYIQEKLAERDLSIIGVRGLSGTIAEGFYLRIPTIIDPNWAINQLNLVIMLAEEMYNVDFYGILDEIADEDMKDNLSDEYAHFWSELRSMGITKAVDD